MTEDDNINQLFRDVFENLEVTPPVSVKMGVDKELGPKKKFRFIFWWLPVLVLLLTGVAFAVVHYGSAAKQPVAITLRSADSKFDENSSPDTDDTSGSTNFSGTEENSRILELPADEGGLKETDELKKADSDNQAFVRKEKKQQQIHLNKAKIPKQKENRNRSIATERFGSRNQQKSGSVSTLKTSGTKSESRAKSSLRKTKRNPKGTTVYKLAYSATGDSGKTTVGILSDTTSKITGPGKTDEKEKTAPAANTDAKDKELKEKGKADSVQKADSLAAVAPADSLLKPDNTKVKPPNDDSKGKNWMVELHGGPRFGRKTSQTDFALKEATSYQIGLGFSRRLNLGPLNYVTLDGEYGSGKENYRSETTTTTLNLIAIDSVPVLDSTQTDTIGYTYTNIYDTVNSTAETNTNSTITRFAFGLRTEFNFNLGEGFGLAVIPGYYYSMSKFKFSDGTTGSSRSSQILLGLGVYYDWNRFRFRIGLDSRYELMSKNQNAFVDKRKSMLFSPQFGIAVKF